MHSRSTGKSVKYCYLLRYSGKVYISHFVTIVNTESLVVLEIHFLLLTIVACGEFVHVLVCGFLS